MTNATNTENLDNSNVAVQEAVVANITEAGVHDAIAAALAGTPVYVQTEADTGGEVEAGTPEGVTVH